VQQCPVLVQQCPVLVQQCPVLVPCARALCTAARAHFSSSYAVQYSYGEAADGKVLEFPTHWIE
jgi:hypothetical protein